MRRKPGTDTNFLRSLPEFGCLSQGLPNGTGCPFVVSPKRLSTRGPLWRQNQEEQIGARRAAPPMPDSPPA
jgi:hypothetical protein